jgi:hypothetical protein
VAIFAIPPLSLHPTAPRSRIDGIREHRKKTAQADYCNYIMIRRGARQHGVALLDAAGVGNRLVFERW